MAFVAGKETSFSVDDSGGTLRDISAYVNDVSFSRPVDTYETTTFGKDDKVYIIGLRDGTFSTSGFWDPTLDGYVAPTLGQTAGLEWSYGPAGTDSGNVEYTQTSSTDGIVFTSSYDISGSVGDANSFSAEYQISGTPARGTF